MSGLYGRQIDRAADVPSGEHWVILEDRSVHVPGDQRSRDFPGHGYPEGTERFMSYTVYAGQKEFEAALRAHGPASRVRGIHVTEVYSLRNEVRADVVRDDLGSGDRH